jgi:hypothetical protein
MRFARLKKTGLTKHQRRERACPLLPFYYWSVGRRMPQTGGSCDLLTRNCVSEPNARARNQILYRARDQNVVRSADVSYTGGDVHCYPPYIVLRQFDLTGVHADAYRKV